MKQLKSIGVKAFIFLFITVLIILSLGPFLWVLVSSLKLNSEILSSTFGFPTGLHFKNYVNAFTAAP